MEDFSTDLTRFRSFVTREGTAPGDRIPPEPELALQMGVTRNRVRRLLKAAESEGLIWRHVGKGTFIGGRDLAELPSGLPNQISPLEAFEARLFIEPRLAAMAAARALAPEIEEMRQLVAQMRDTETRQEWLRHDLRLHRIMAKAARNTLLLALYDTVRECLPQNLRFRIQNLASSDVDDEHEAWVEAIANHEPQKAEQLMRQHIESIRQRIFGTL